MRAPDARERHPVARGLLAAATFSLVVLLGLAAVTYRSLPAQPAAAEQVVIGDTYVADYGADPPVHDGPHDKSTLLFVAKNDQEPHRLVAFLRFDVAELRGAEVEKALLSLHMNSCRADLPEGGGSVAVADVATDWTAPLVTSRNIPELGRSLVIAVFDDPVTPGPRDMEWDITRLAKGWVQGEPNHGLALVMDDFRIDHGECDFASSETSRPPRLKVQLKGSVHVLLLPWANVAESAGHALQ